MISINLKYNNKQIERKKPNLPFASADWAFSKGIKVFADFLIGLSPYQPFVIRGNKVNGFFKLNKRSRIFALIAHVLPFLSALKELTIKFKYQ